MFDTYNIRLEIAMNYECTLKTVTPQPTMSVRGLTTMEALSNTIGEYLGEVWQVVEMQGGQFAGPPFTRYHSVSEAGIDLEAGLPVIVALPSQGRVQAGELPGGEVVATIHVGPYEQLPDAGAALLAWVAEHNREVGGPNWEIYLTDPGEVSDPAKWQTEVVLPLK